MRYFSLIESSGKDEVRVTCVRHQPPTKNEDWFYVLLLLKRLNISITIFFVLVQARELLQQDSNEWDDIQAQVAGYMPRLLLH